MKLYSIDLLIVAVYLSVMAVMMVRYARRSTGAEDYFLAGRSLNWVLIGFSLFASNISSTTMVGLAGAAYNTGISVANYEWMAAVVLVPFAVFFVPIYLRARLYTMPEFLELRFSRSCRYYFSVLTIIGNVFIDTAGTLFAGALVIRTFFPEVPLITSAIILCLLAGAYTAAGGLRAVVYTDCVQAVILLIGSAVLTWLSIDAAGSWSEVVARTPPEMLSLIRPLDDPTMPWLGTLIGVPVLGFYFWCTNQFIVQRVLGARSVEHARWGSIFAGALKLLVLFIMVFPGIIAKVIFPELERPDQVFPVLVSELMPPGARGLIVASLLAAIMSSLDSTLNSASTLVTMDFILRWFPGMTQRQLGRIGRFVTLSIMVISVLWVPIVAQAETLFSYLQQALAYLFPPVVAVFLLGVFSRRTNARGALAGLVGGHLISLAVFIERQTTAMLAGVHFLHLCGLFFFASLVLVAAASRTAPPPEPERIAPFVFERKLAAPFRSDGAAAAIDYRLGAAMLVFLTLLLVYAYR